MLLFGRYWLKGTADFGSPWEVRLADMSSFFTSGSFRWGKSGSESLPLPEEERMGAENVCGAHRKVPDGQSGCIRDVVDLWVLRSLP